MTRIFANAVIPRISEGIGINQTILCNILLKMRDNIIVIQSKKRIEEI